MISTDEIKKYTCQILPTGTSGTGIFVRTDLILTCKHVIAGMSIGDIIKIKNSSGNEFLAHIKATCSDTDLAILVTKDYQSGEIATLSDCEIIIDLPWACHGHPNTPDGNAVGTPLRGQIIDHIIDSTETTHDVSLSVSGISLNATYSGFSGSGVINKEGHVVSILRYKNNTYLNAVSIRKAAKFLRDQTIYVKDDELDDFTHFIDDAFGSFEDGIREICKVTGNKVATNVTPQVITETLKGILFFPTEKGTTKDIITKLRKDSPTNKKLWIGWMKFLTYIALAKGEYQDANKISISLASAQLSKIMNVELTPMTLPLTINLNFFFTDQERFISITSEYIATKWMNEDLQDNSCHIFNSPHADFGHQNLTAERKNNIVASITSPVDAGYTVPGKIDFGVISLNELTREIAKSQTVAEATKNLENLFRNALN